MSYIESAIPVNGGPLIQWAIGHTLLAGIADAGILFKFTIPSTDKGRYEIVSLHSKVEVVASTAAKLTTLTVTKKRPASASAQSTGVVLALTTANQDTLFEVADSTSTGTLNARQFIGGDELSVVASSTTAFVQGSSFMYLMLRYTPFQ